MEEKEQEGEAKLAKLSDSTTSTLQEKALQGQELCQLSIKYLPPVTKILVSTFHQILYLQQLSGKIDESNLITFETDSNLRNILDLVIDELIQQSCIDSCLDFLYFAVGNYRMADEHNNVTTTRTKSKLSSFTLKDPAGHTLLYYKDSLNRYVTGFKCDICGKSFRPSVPAYACIQCRYDVCLVCHQKNVASSLDVGFSKDDDDDDERIKQEGKVDKKKMSIENATWRPVGFPIELKDERKTNFLNKLWEMTCTLKDENVLNKYISIIWATLIDDSLRKESIEIGKSKNVILLLLNWIENSDSQVDFLITCCGTLASAINNMIVSEELNLQIKNAMMKTIEKFRENDNVVENIFQVLFNISTSRELLFDNTVCALKARMLT